jgi:hypothetical protein
LSEELGLSQGEEKGRDKKKNRELLKTAPQKFLDFSLIMVRERVSHTCLGSAGLFEPFLASLHT